MRYMHVPSILSALFALSVLVASPTTRAELPASKVLAATSAKKSPSSAAGTKGKKKGSKKSGKKNAGANADKKRDAMLKALDARLHAIDDGSAGVDDTDSKGNTALMLAAVLSEKDAVTLLLEKGADPSLRNARGKSAADLCKDEELARLIRASAPPTTWDEMIAQVADAPELVEACTKVKEGGDINAGEGKLFEDMIFKLCWGYGKDAKSDRKRALRYAAFFIEQGADINIGKGKILGKAAHCGCNDMVRFLLSKGADPLAHGNILYPPVTSASSYRGASVSEAIDVITTLMQQEAIQKKIEQEPGYLAEAARAATRNHLCRPEVLEAILSGTRNAAAMDAAFLELVAPIALSKPEEMWQICADKGVTPAGYDKALLKAIMYANKEATDYITFILEKGKPTQEGKDKALKLAREKKEEERAELLIRHGAKAP